MGLAHSSFTTPFSLTSLHCWEWDTKIPFLGSPVVRFAFCHTFGQWLTYWRLQWVSGKPLLFWYRCSSLLPSPSSILLPWMWMWWLELWQFSYGHGQEAKRVLEIFTLSFLSLWYNSSPTTSWILVWRKKKFLICLSYYLIGYPFTPGWIIFFNREKS